MEKYLNIGILAHVDAGKTSVTEQILFLSNVTKEAGSVDKGTTCSDSLPVEKARGISVKSSILSTKWNDVHINIIDTPGHIDFSGDVERALNAVDFVLLVVSAVEGIQSQTEILINLLIDNKIPFAIFINKIDRVGSDIEVVFKKLNESFSANFINFSNIENEGTKEAISNYLFEERKISDEIIESICELDDYLLDRYLNGESPAFKILENVLKRELKQQKLVPVLAGSAMFEMGILELVDFLTKYCCTSFRESDNSPSFQTISVNITEKKGKQAFVRLFDGKIKTREIVEINGNEEKVTQIEKINGIKTENVEFLTAGQVGIVYGLSSLKSGDIVGKPKGLKQINMGQSVLDVEVEPKDIDDFLKILDALYVLNEEDPNLNFRFDKNEKLLSLNVRGLIQIEILKQIISDRFNLACDFSTPTVIYKETIIDSGYGFAKYTMPKPCWAILKFQLEPLGLGGGIQYSSEVSTDKIERKYQNEVEMVIKQSLEQGPLGWSVTDLKITLVDGEDHNVHSNPGDFKLATPMGIMNGLVNCKTTLLEPIATFKIVAPDELAGKIINDLVQMRGEFQQPQTYDNKVEIRGIIPVSTSYEYGILLSSRTSGKGYFMSTFNHYAQCEVKDGMTRPYKGINPLDTAKYILHMRKAIN